MTKGRDWRPKSSGTQGELKIVTALQTGGFSIRCFNVPIRTRFSIYTFLCDTVIDAQQPWGRGKETILEIQGELHYHTWGGRPALKRMAKDQVKMNCLLAEGFGYVEGTRKEALKRPELILDRVMQAWEGICNYSVLNGPFQRPPSN